MNLKKYFKIWLGTTLLSIQTHLATRGASLLYIIGKLIRFGFFLILLFVVLGKTKRLAGYNLEQMLIFFFVFNLLDILAQLFFRGIYWFRNDVVSGRFDLILLKPLNPIFQVLTAQTDFLDLPLLLIVLFFLSSKIVILPFKNLLLFSLLFVCGFLIILSIHILVACLGVLTTEVDRAIWIYRDLSLMARVPVDMYSGSVRTFLTFVIPIGLVFTLPAKALMGKLSWQWGFYAFGISITIFLISLRFWRFSLTKYSSASS